MRAFYKMLHWFFLGRAVSRGPAYLARYEERRQLRKLAYRLARGSRRRS